MGKITLKTEPTKKVLAQSLTRDVTAEACINDLIDNAIDAAGKQLLELYPDDVDEYFLPTSYSGYEIKLEIGQTGIRITDNCGGMTSGEAADSVLRFGDPSEKEYGIGLYGVGLNRAIFKLGNVAHIITTTSTEQVAIKFVVSDYLENDGWEISADVSSPVGEPGTIIRITAPTPDALSVIGTTASIEKYKQHLSETYYRFLQKGIVIKVNDDEIEPRFVELRQDSPFPLMKKKRDLANGVVLEIVAGQHKDHKFSAEPKFKKSCNDDLTKDYGWTIMCNDRPIVFRNRESKTGWDGTFHTEFYGFVGYVRFYSENGRLLPWNTAKTDVDIPNDSYQVALDEMSKFTKKWRQYGRVAKEAKKNDEVLLPWNQQDTPIVSPLEDDETDPAPTPNEPSETVRPKKSWAILPPDIDDTHCLDKLKSVVDEAKNIHIKRRRYTSLALMRMLFEISSLHYLMQVNRRSALQKMIVDDANQKRAGRGQKPLTKPEARKLQPSLENICSFLKKNPDVWGAELQNHMEESLNSFINRKPKMNSALHHPIHAIGAKVVEDIRDEILPILRHFIEQEKLEKTKQDNQQLVLPGQTQ